MQRAAGSTTVHGWTRRPARPDDPEGRGCASSQRGATQRWHGVPFPSIRQGLIGSQPLSQETSASRSRSDSACNTVTSSCHSANATPAEFTIVQPLTPRIMRSVQPSSRPLTHDRETLVGVDTMPTVRGLLATVRVTNTSARATPSVDLAMSLLGGHASRAHHAHQIKPVDQPHTLRSANEWGARWGNSRCGGLVRERRDEPPSPWASRRCWP
jgi:hypothetical protein